MNSLNLNPHEAQPTPETPGIRFLRLKEVQSICGKSRSSIYDAIKKGEFPKPIKLGENTSGWIDSEIAAWMQNCIRASRTK